MNEREGGGDVFKEATSKATAADAEHSARARNHPVIRLDDWGRVVCQVMHCEEAARPWGYVLDEDGLQIEVFLCARHERDFAGVPPRDAL